MAEETVRRRKQPLVQSIEDLEAEGFRVLATEEGAEYELLLAGTYSAKNSLREAFASLRAGRLDEGYEYVRNALAALEHGGESRR